MRKIVRTVKTVKTMGFVVVKRHVAKLVVDVVRTVKKWDLCASWLSRAMIALSAAYSVPAVQTQQARALAPACQGRWQRSEGRWGRSRPPQFSQ